jgi:hypothetical protein
MYYFKYIILFLTQSIHCAWESGSNGSDWRTLSCGKWHCSLVEIYVCFVVSRSLRRKMCSSPFLADSNSCQLTWNHMLEYFSVNMKFCYNKNSGISHEWHSLHEFQFCVDVISTVQFSRFSPQLITHITVHCTWRCMNLKRFCMKIEIGSGSFL